jgi:lipoprotein NlpD
VQSLESRELTPIAPAPLPALAAVPALVPGPAAMPLATDPVPSPAPASSWIWPAKGRVASRFHPESLHGADRGIEIAVAEDAEVVAVSDGVVTYTGAPREYGNLVIIRHPDDVLSVYAFTKRILVEKDQHVTQGQQIAVAGSAGDRGPLLHFEVRRRGAAIDPASVLPPL